MNKTFSITVAILSVVAVVSVLFIQHIDAAALNENFGIETLYGDANLIDEVFEISAIRQEGSNSFARVILTTEQAEITSISFDSRHQLDDRQLENREFYRGTDRWQREGTWHLRNNTDNFNIFTIWHYPGSTTHFMNTATGEFAAFSLNSTSNFVYWADDFFLEHEGELYYILVEFDQPRASVYVVNFANERLEYQFSVSQEESKEGVWFATQNGLYFYEFERFNAYWTEVAWDPEINEDVLESSGNSLYAINFNTREFDSRPSPTGIIDNWASARFGDYILFDGVLIDSDNNLPTVLRGSTMVNLETGQRHILADAVTADLINDNWTSTEYHALNNFLVGVFRTNQFTQYIIIYDLNTMEKIYHGRVNLRRDQGLLSNDWGWIRSFEINLR